jgi:hypothetical protein
MESAPASGAWIGHSVSLLLLSMFASAPVSGMAGYDIHLVRIRQLDNRSVTAAVDGSETDGTDSVRLRIRLEIRRQDHRFREFPRHAMASAVLQIPSLPDEAHTYMYNILFQGVQAERWVTQARNQGILPSTRGRSTRGGIPPLVEFEKYVSRYLINSYEFYRSLPLGVYQCKPRKDLALRGFLFPGQSYDKDPVPCPSHARK